MPDEYPPSVAAASAFTSLVPARTMSAFDDGNDCDVGADETGEKVDDIIDLDLDLDLDDAVVGKSRVDAHRVDGG